MINKDYNKKWYQKNKERLRKKSLQYHYDNRDKVLKRMADYNKKHKKKHRKIAREYYIKNKQKMDESFKKWRQKNIKHDRQRSREYYYKHREKMINAAAGYAKKNREKINNRIKNKIKSDPTYKLKLTLQSRTSAALTRYSSSAFEEFLGCTIQEARKHLESLFKPGMTWLNHGKWHIDHIKPVSSFDLRKKDQIYQCFNYRNLQPLWAKENLSKGAKYTNKKTSN